MSGPSQVDEGEIFDGTKTDISSFDDHGYQNDNDDDDQESLNEKSISPQKPFLAVRKDLEQSLHFTKRFHRGKNWRLFAKVSCKLQLQQFPVDIQKLFVCIRVPRVDAQV